MNRMLLISSLLLVAIIGCKEDPVFHGVPELNVRDGMIVVENTTDAQMNYIIFSIRLDGIRYMKEMSAYISPGDSLLIRLSDFEGIDSSKPVGERMTPFPDGRLPDRITMSGRFTDETPFTASWPPREADGE